VATLTRIGSTRVYAGATAPGERGFLAFLVWTLPPSPEQEISIQTAWEDSAYTGWFTILPEEPSGLAAFAQALQDSEPLPTPAHTSFAWIIYTGSTQQIEVVKALPMKSAAPHATVAASTVFAFLNYGFTIHQDSPVLLSGGSRFVFEHPPLTGFPSPNAENLSLPFEGLDRFCFESQGFISDFSDSAETGTDVALRFYSGERQIDYWRYQIFESPAAGLQYLFRMNWDLLAPLDETRTFLAFTNIAFQLSSTGEPDPVWSLTPVQTDGAMPSALRTLYGAAVKLRPRITGAAANRARLVFESVPGAAGKPARYNLVPCGDFEVVLSPERGTDLLCGLSGTEFITIDAAAGTLLRFHPKQPAYAPVFPLLKPEGGATAQPLLTDRFRTAWVSVGAESGSLPVYYSQPSDSPLFTTQSSSTSEVLKLYNPAVADLVLGRPFPLAAYALASAGTPRELGDFEKQILAPFRHQSIVTTAPKRAISATNAALTVSATPQGFLAEIEGFVWKQVLLARTNDLAGGSTQLAFRNLLDPLREAFQSSELFLVISRNQNLGQFENRIMIADWPFIVNLPPETADSFANVLIVKFCEGSLEERARDTSAWTNAEAFNKKPVSATAAAIIAYIRQAEAQSAEVPALNNFVSIVRDPGWNGVLALRVDIELSAFPDDLKGLLGGMDLTRFYGHHLGLSLNFIQRGQQLEMPPDSSLFALINYRDQYGDPGRGSSGAAQDTPPATAPQLSSPADLSSSFDYRVISMLVEFRNSEVINFESRVILTISKLFGETAALASSSSPQFRNSLVFDGNRQVINLKPSYAFHTREQYRFLLSGTVVKYAQVSSAQFITLAQDTSSIAGDPTERVRARFNLSGYLNFYAMPEFDAFSFGDTLPATDLPTAGLQFANLGIGMEFDLPAATPLYFSLDPTLMSFDTGLSQPRDQSLFRKFPLTMSALLTGSPDKGVKDLGYVPVRVREFSKLGNIGAEWYGLAFILNLGTLGALANNAGFAATLLVAWSPGGPPNPAQVLLNLPGLGTGKKEIGLQSVLKLTLGSIELSPQLDSEKQITAYLLSLRNIALSFLGKKLPTSGVTDLALFSDFRKEGGGSSLSWYAAYYTEPPAARLPDTEVTG